MAESSEKLSAYNWGVKSDFPFQHAWDNTSLSVLRACPRKYFYQNVMGLRGRKTSPDLVFGIYYHKALETFDSAILTNDHKTATRIALRCALEISENWESDHKLKNRKVLVRAVFNYTEHFRNDPFKTVELRSGKAAVELSFRLELDLQSPTGESYLLSGHLDRVGRSDDGSLWVLDRKTSSRAIDTNYIEHYKPSGQMLQYTFAGKVILEEPIAGVMIDAVHLQTEGESFGRFPIAYTEEQLQEWLDNTKYYVLLYERFAEAGSWPQNYESCHHYSGCQFRQLCSASPRMREVYIRTDYIVDRWDPLKVR